MNWSAWINSIPVIMRVERCPGEIPGDQVMEGRRRSDALKEDFWWIFEDAVKFCTVFKHLFVSQIFRLPLWLPALFSLPNSALFSLFSEQSMLWDCCSIINFVFADTDSRKKELTDRDVEHTHTSCRGIVIHAGPHLTSGRQYHIMRSSWLETFF